MRTNVQRSANGDAVIASFKGSCIDCEVWIAEGDEIVASDDRHNPGWKHFPACPQPRKVQFCPECFTQLPATGVCDFC